MQRAFADVFIHEIKVVLFQLMYIEKPKVPLLSDTSISPEGLDVFKIHYGHRKETKTFYLRTRVYGTKWAHNAKCTLFFCHKSTEANHTVTLPSSRATATLQ